MLIRKEKVKRILCIKLRGIGDVVISSVVFGNLLKEFPEAKIDFLTEAPSKSALEKIPLLNDVLIFKKESILSSLLLILKVKLKGYDLILDFFSNPRTALITFLSGAKYRAGFPYRGRRYAYNLFGPSERNKYHAVDLHLEFLKTLDITNESKDMYFGIDEDDKKFAAGFFNEKFNGCEFVVGLSPSGGWESKKCDPIKFAEIGDEIVRKYSARILVLWGPGDQKDALEISKLMKSKVVLAPMTDLRRMGALIERCSLLIANDSGPMHIAAALRVPVLSLHGPTDPKLQGPFGDQNETVRYDSLHCIGCNLLKCPFKHECFLELPVEAVIHKLDSLIQKNELVLPIHEKN